MPLFVLSVLLSVAPPLVTVEGETFDAEGRTATEVPLLGLSMEAGVPDGLTASLTLTPGRYLRLSAGVVSNGMGLGARLGVALVALPSWYVRPFVSADGGYVFAGVGAWLTPLLPDPALQRAAQSLTVAYMSAHAGLELGSQRVYLTLRGGFSYLDASIGSQSVEAGATATVSASAIALRGVIPSARLGLAFGFD